MSAAAAERIEPSGRLLLLSGPGGSGTSTMCAATVAAADAEGLRPLLLARGTEPHPGAQALASGTLGRILGEMGADPLPAVSWTGLPGLDAVSLLLHAADGLADPAVDAVVVDAGPLDRLVELAALPSLLLRLLDAALTPRLAMWRAAGEVESGPVAFETLSAARTVLLELDRTLSGPRTAVRLVTTATADGVDRVAEGAAQLAMLGLLVEGVAVTRLGRARDGWPEPLLAEQERQWRRVRDLLPGVATWKAHEADRPMPKGRPVLDALDALPALRPEALEPAGLGDQYVVELPLAGPGPAVARAGRLGDDLVVEIGGVRRWLPLPAVLRRCRATHAERTPSGLRLTFDPDPGLWRRPEEVPA